jgi:hypothetical protein
VRATAEECAAHFKVEVAIEPMLDIQPAAMAPALIELIGGAAADCGA